MRAASPLRQMERENEMIVISHRLFVFVIPFKAFIVSARVAPPAEGAAILTRGMPLAVSSTRGLAVRITKSIVIEMKVEIFRL